MTYLLSHILIWPLLLALYQNSCCEGQMIFPRCLSYLSYLWQNTLWFWNTILKLLTLPEPNLVVFFLRLTWSLSYFYFQFSLFNLYPKCGYSSEIYLGHLSNLFLLNLLFILRMPNVILKWITKLCFVELLESILDGFTYVSRGFKGILEMKVTTLPQYPPGERKGKHKLPALLSLC